MLANAMPKYIQSVLCLHISILIEMI